MKRYFGGNKVVRGYYMNLSTAEYVVPDASLELPGSSEESFIRVPSWMAVITGPLFGLVFVILLPLVGIAGLIGFLAYKAGFASTNIGKIMLSPILNGLRQGETESPKNSK